MRKQQNKQNNRKIKKTNAKKDKEEANAAPPRVPDPVRVQHQTVRSALLAYSPMVREGSDLAAYLAALGIHTRESADWNNPRSDHPVTHVCRLMAVCQAIIELISDDVYVTVIDYYGRDWHLHLPRCAPGVTLDIVPRRGLENKVYGGDMCRSGASSIQAPRPFVTPPCGMIACDIYQHLEPTKPLTALALATAMHDHGVTVCVLINHDLREPYGGHTFKATVGDGDDRRNISTMEATWESTYVGSDRFISFTPGASTSPYPLHPYVDLCWTGSTQVGLDGQLWWLHTHPLNRVGPYCLTKIVLTQLETVEVMPVMQPEVRYSTERIVWSATVASILASWIPLTWKQTLNPAARDSKDFQCGGLVAYQGAYPVDTRALAECQLFLGFQALNGRTMAALLSTARAAVEKDAPCMRSFPRLMVTTTFNTAMLAMTHRMDPEFLANYVAEFDHVTENTRRAVLTGKIGSIAWSTWFWRHKWKFLTATALCAIALYGASAPGGTAWFSLPAAASTVGAVPQKFFNWIAPSFAASRAYAALASAAHLSQTACEEFVKWFIGGPAITALMVGETIASSAHHPTWASLAVARVPSLVFHCATWGAYRTYGWRALIATIPCHWAFNFGATAVIYTSPRIQSLVHITPDDLDTGLSAMAGLAWFNQFWRWVITLFGEPPLDFNEFRLAWDQNLECRPGIVQGVADARLCATPPISWWYSTGFKEWRWRELVVSIDAQKIHPADLSPTECAALSARLEWSAHPCICSGINVPADQCLRCAECPPSDFAYIQLQTSGALRKPTSSPAATLAGLASRWFNDPYFWRSTPRVEDSWLRQVRAKMTMAWPDLQDLFGNLEVVGEWYTVEECARFMGTKSKGALLLASDLRAHLHFEQIESTSQPKANEVTKGVVEADGVVRQKPRLIINVHPSVQARLLPVSRRLTDALKNKFDGNTIVSVAGFLVSFIVADPTPRNMQRYAKLMQRGDVATILVSCDDTACDAGPYQEEFGAIQLETDFSEYDQSQHAAFSEVDHLLPAPAEWHAIHDVVLSLPSVSKRTSVIRPGSTGPFVSIKALLRWAMRTGVATTSIFGSVHNITSWVYWLHRLRQELEAGRRVSYEDTSFEIGLTAKVSLHHTRNSMTFLKGVFIDDTWNVLPSACLKIGKSMVPSWRRIHHPAPDVVLFYAVCQSIQVPPSYPILGAYLKLAKKLMRAQEGCDLRAASEAYRMARDPTIVENSQYKVVSSRAPRRLILEWMFRRYGLIEADVVEAENMILSVESLPAIVSHSVFVRLRDIDYE
jgi:hypothetical protein